MWPIGTIVIVVVMLLAVVMVILGPLFVEWWHRRIK